MTIVNTTIPVTTGAAQQLLRPLPVMPTGTPVTPSGAVITPLGGIPSPLAMNMDPVSFQQWWTAVSQLNGSRPGTPLAALNAAQLPFPRIASPTLEQMQQVQQQQNAQAQLQQAEAMNAMTLVQAKKNAAAAAAASQLGGKQKTTGKLGGGKGSPSPNVGLAGGRAVQGVQGNAEGAGSMPLKASRHKYAEQRRRNRINERLDQLRTLVPHTEGSNIAGFLDQVITYVVRLQHKLNIDPQGQLQQGEQEEQLPSVGQIRNLVNNNGNGNVVSNTTLEREGEKIEEQAASNKKRPCATTAEASKVDEAKSDAKRAKTE